MKRASSRAYRVAAVSIVLMTAAVTGQEAPVNDQPSLTASLLLVKADWSKSELAISINEDLQKALKDESVPADLRGRLPASATTILFPAETALIYQREHYFSLVQWLEKNQLFVQAEERFSEAARQQPQAAALVLTKGLDFLGLSLFSPPADQALVSRRVALSWLIEKQFSPALNGNSAPNGNWIMMRTLATSEKPRGQEQYVSRGVQDQCRCTLPTLGNGEVLIVPAFPARDDSTFQAAATQQGFIALVVVQATPQPATPPTEARFLLPDKVERLRVLKTQNASGSLWFGQPGSPQSTRYIIARDIMVSWSEGRDVAWGFSKSLGKWASQKIDPPAPDSKGLAVDDELAVWRVNSAYYAFSGKTGTWDVLRLPEGHSPPQVLDSGFSRVHDGDDLFTFSAATGRWSSPTGIPAAQQAEAADDLELKKREIEGQYNSAHENLLAVEQQLTEGGRNLSSEERRRLEVEQAKLRPQVKSFADQLEMINQRLGQVNRAGESEATTRAPTGAGTPSAGSRIEPAAGLGAREKQFVVLHLKYLQAATADRMIRQLFPVSVAADERTNSLVVSADSDTLEKVKAMLAEIDREPPPQAQSATWSSTKSSEWAAKKPDELAARYEAKEREAQRLATQIRELQTAPKEHAGAIKDLSAQLRRVVGEAFAERQQLHRAEVGQLQQRVAGIEQRLKTRGQFSKEIIERRIKDLLNPNLQWETTATSSPKASAANTLNEKTELFARLHDDPQWIENAKDDFQRAATDEERKSALEVQLSWWRDIVKALRRLEQLGEPIDGELATAQAGAKKTEAELAALPAAGSRGSTNSTSATPKVTVGGWGPESEHLWAALGLTVQKVTREDASDPKLVGGMKIMAIGADSPAKGLEVGDIVQSMMLTGSFPNVTRATLQVVRGSEHFPVFVDFPAPRSAATRAYSPASGWPADTLPGRGANSPTWPSQPTTPSISLNAGGQTVTVRSADDFRKELREAEEAVANVKSWMAGLDPTGKGEKVTERERESAEKVLPSWERRLKWVRDQYDAQLRLLELELKDAASAVESAKKAEEVARILHQQGRTQFNQLNDAQRALEAATLRVERANTLLDLYRKADPKRADGESSRPELPPTEPKQQKTPSREL
jgi:hypothetical protein